MFFSIIIPTYNRGELLRRALISVLKQKTSASNLKLKLKFEVIIVDDGSTDGTKEMIADLIVANDAIDNDAIDVNYIRSEKNYGVSWARNQGITISKGEWICFLDSDDEWLKNKLLMTYEYHIANPHIKIIHGNEIWIRNGIRVNQMKKHQKYGGYIFEKCLPLCLISPSAVAIHRDVFVDRGVFREDFIVCEDYELWLRITHKYQIGFIDKPIIVKYGGHQDQLSKKYVAMDYYRVVAMFDFLNQNYLLIDEQTKELILKEIIFKSEVLLNGYRKHNNFANTDKTDRIEEIYNFVKSAVALMEDK